VGASKVMHTVIENQCTGCELCISACPVDCISLRDVTPNATGWTAWSEEQAAQARGRYEFRTARLARDKREQIARLEARAAAKLDDLAAHSTIEDPTALDHKKAVVEAALARARAQRPPRAS
jgi:electron transport complex protein RnfB